LCPKKQRLINRHRIEDALHGLVGELEHAFLVTTGTKPTPVATERREVLLAAARTRAADAGETLAEISAGEIVFHHFVHHGSEEAIALFEHSRV
jgi:hypothetical protein